MKRGNRIVENCSAKYCRWPLTKHSINSTIY
jgi:hypothetical protein